MGKMAMSGELVSQEHIEWAKFNWSTHLANNFGSAARRIFTIADRKQGHLNLNMTS